MTPLKKLPDEGFRRNIYGGGCFATTPIYSGGKLAWWLFAVESTYILKGDWTADLRTNRKHGTP